MKTFLICLALNVSLLGAVFAQNYTQSIRGKVVDAVMGLPLPGATVQLLHREAIIGTTTNNDGVFALPNIDLGRQSIEISFIGYKPVVVNNLLLVSGKEIFVEVKLEENIQQMEEVVVKAEKSKDRARNEMAFISARTFSVEETERFAGSMGDPSRMVASYAGVVASDDSRNDIVIRGNSPSGLIWRIEGIEVPNPNHFAAQGTTGGPVSMLNNNLLANSDFMTSAFPAEFGNGNSGVFDIKLRSGNNQKMEYTGQVGFNGFELGAEGPLGPKGKASFLVNGRYSTLEVMDKIGFDVGTGSAVPEYRDFNLLVDIPGTRFGRFKLLAIGGKSMIRLGRDFVEGEVNSYSVRGTAIDFGSEMYVGGITHNYFFNESTRLYSTLSYQYSGSTTVMDSIRNKGTQVLPYYRGDFGEGKLIGSTQLKKKVSSRSNFIVGLTYDMRLVDNQDSVYTFKYKRFIQRSNIQDNLMIYRAFSQWQQNIGERIVANVGVHSLFNSLNNDYAVEPRLGVNYKVNQSGVLNVGYGRHSQILPSLVYFEQTYDETNNSYFTTNENLEMMHSSHYVVGYDYLVSSNFRIKAEAYYQNLSNIPVKKEKPEYTLLNQGAGFGMDSEDSLSNAGAGRNYGIELTLERFLKNGFYFLSTVSIFDSKYQGGDDKWRNTAFNGNYVVNVLGGYEFKIGSNSMLTLDLNSVLAGGRPFVPIDLEKSRQMRSMEYDWSQAYENKNNPYFRADLRVGLRLNSRRFSQEWALELKNVTNYQSEYLKAYDLENDEVYSIYQQGLMPMMLYRVLF